MTTKNLQASLARVLGAIYLDEAQSRGHIFDRVLELSRFITAILKNSGHDNIDIIEFYGLEENVETGMPNDSQGIIAYTLAANICNDLFNEKAKIDADNSEKFEDIIAEYEASRENTKLH